MTKIMHLPAPQRNITLVPMNPAGRQNVVAIRTFQRDPMRRAYHPESELLDRIQVWINEGGRGGDIQ